MGDRGVGHLYEPARAGNSDALCLTAARFFMDLKAGEHVFLLTGSLTRNWVSKRIAETDGPIGTAVLARTLSYGFNAIPVVLISSQRPVSGEFQPSALVTAVTKLEWECAGCRCPVYSSWRQDLPGSEDGLATTLRCIELGRLRDRGSHCSVGLCRACSLASASVTSGYTPMANVLRFPAKR